MISLGDAPLLPPPPLASACRRLPQAAWPPANRQPDEQLATFAGGCFWGVELAFQVGHMSLPL